MSVGRVCVTALLCLVFQKKHFFLKFRNVWPAKQVLREYDWMNDSVTIMSSQNHVSKGI